MVNNNYRKNENEETNAQCDHHNDDETKIFSLPVNDMSVDTEFQIIIII